MLLLQNIVYFFGIFPLHWFEVHFMASNTESVSHLIDSKHVESEQWAYISYYTKCLFGHFMSHSMVASFITAMLVISNLFLNTIQCFIRINHLVFLVFVVFIYLSHFFFALSSFVCSFEWPYLNFAFIIIYFYRRSEFGFQKMC